MVDPVTAPHPGPRSEDRTLGSQDLSVNEQVNACPNYTLDSFKMGSKKFRREIGAYLERKNEKPSPIKWQFTNKKTRIKLKSLYPAV